MLKNLLKKAKIILALSILTHLSFGELFPSNYRVILYKPTKYNVKNLPNNEKIYIMNLYTKPDRDFQDNLRRRVLNLPKDDKDDLQLNLPKDDEDDLQFITIAMTLVDVLFLYVYGEESLDHVIEHPYKAFYYALIFMVFLCDNKCHSIFDYLLKTKETQTFIKTFSKNFFQITQNALEQASLNSCKNIDDLTKTLNKLATSEKDFPELIEVDKFLSSTYKNFNKLKNNYFLPTLMILKIFGGDVSNYSKLIPKIPTSGDIILSNIQINLLSGSKEPYIFKESLIEDFKNSILK